MAKERELKKVSNPHNAKNNFCNFYGRIFSLISWNTTFYLKCNGEKWYVYYYVPLSLLRLWNTKVSADIMFLNMKKNHFDRIKTDLWTNSGIQVKNHICIKKETNLWKFNFLFILLHFSTCCITNKKANNVCHFKAGA